MFEMGWLLSGILVLPARDSPYLLSMNSEERMTCEDAAVAMTAMYVLSFVFWDKRLMLILLANFDAKEKEYWDRYMGEYKQRLDCYGYLLGVFKLRQAVLSSIYIFPQPRTGLLKKQIISLYAIIVSKISTRVKTPQPKV